MRGDVRSIHSNAAVPTKSGCELGPFASVSGSCPPIAEDEADGHDGDDHQQDLHEDSLLCGWS
jgi:hypothetical protein